jgi:hypothetical protein
MTCALDRSTEILDYSVCKHELYFSIAAIQRPSRMQNICHLLDRKRHCEAKWVLEVHSGYRRTDPTTAIS